jgi:membrane peptidoglycan carboxypeptidase
MPQQHRTATGVLGGLLGFLGLSVAAGVLVTATVTPALAVTGIATNSTINVFDGLPDYLALDELAQKSNIYATDSAGNPQLLASFYQQNRIEVGWDQINQFVKDAAIAAEDPRFYEHGGVDLTGTIRAVAISATGRDLQGGSSITQQYVKNVLVQKAEAITDEAKMKAAYEEATKTTPERKLKEMRMAIGLEKRYGKQDILRGYLNITGFGGRVYGIEAAANYYFNTTAANLTLEQAATLLAVVNNPSNLRFDQPENEVNGAADGYSKTKDRRDYILGKMLAEKKITQEQYDAAIVTVITPTITPSSTGCITAVNVSPGAGYFCDYVTRVFQNNPIFGATEDERWAAFNRGGYDVFTTLDLDVQYSAQTALDAYIPHASDQLDIGAVAVTVQPGTGRILAMAQNKDYASDEDTLALGSNYSAVNYNTDVDYGGSTGFQPGSTYKTFTLAEWLKEGHGLNEGVDGRKRSPWGTFKDSCADGGTVYAGSDWNPGNDEGGNGGQYTALQSTKQSINTGFIAMAKQLDLCGIRKTAESMGVHRADGGPLLQSPATVLGTNEVAPLSMATAFATFASGGTTCDPIAIDRVVKPDGTEIPVPQLPGRPRGERRGHRQRRPPGHLQRRHHELFARRRRHPAHRQDGYHRQQRGDLDERCQHPGRDDRRCLQRDRPRQPPPHLLRRGPGGHDPTQDLAADHGDRQRQVRWLGVRRPGSLADQRSVGPGARRRRQDDRRSAEAARGRRLRLRERRRR